MEKNYKEIVSVVDSELIGVDKIISEDVFYPTEDLNNFLFSSGKKIRSVLAFLFLKMFGCEINSSQINLQAAVELAHNASLIHDDIIDMSKIRRKSETFEVKFDTKTAVMTGDYILSLAFKKLLKTENSEILKEFVETFSHMAYGEINQYFERSKIPALESYIEKTINKTAKLFETGLKSSAILAGENAMLWGDFGLNFGTAFQIKNDLENLSGDNSDINNGIYTAPVIFSGSVDVSADGIHKTKLLINNYINICREILQKCPQNEYRQALFNILELYEND
ncbi:polyprenyl synthetase family protein [bacterium]|nr:polyprenyl synthetase family protein [bacterium]